MAIARTGVYVDDYLEYANTLPAELQRLLNTIRELDERSQSMIHQTRQQTKYCLGLSSQSSKKWNNNYNNIEEDEAAIEKMRKEIESNQDSALSLCTEKVLLAQQAYDLIDSHVKRLDEDLNHFAEDLKQGTVVCESLVCIIFGRDSEPFNEFFEQEYLSPWMKTMGRNVNKNQSLTELNSFKPYYLLDYS
ncbi:unnamed protein product [Malus baccata var. baccata]